MTMISVLPSSSKRSSTNKTTTDTAAAMVMKDVTVITVMAESTTKLDTMVTIFLAAMAVVLMISITKVTSITVRNTTIRTNIRRTENTRVAIRVVLITTGTRWVMVAVTRLATLLHLK